MPVITITSRKGGCGKTMIATALAGGQAARGVDVGLLDADPNGSAHRWATKVHEGAPIAAYAEADAERLADLLPELAARHALLICDTAGFGNQAATVCIAAADGVLVPVTPGEGDVVEAQRTVGYVEGLGRSTRRPIPARVLANRIRRGTTLSRHVLAELGAIGLPVLTTVLGRGCRLWRAQLRRRDAPGRHCGRGACDPRGRVGLARLAAASRQSGYS